MDTDTIAFICTAIVVIVLGGLLCVAMYFSKKWDEEEKKRLAGLRHVAHELGFDYQPEGGYEFWKSLQSFYVFQQGWHGRMVNVLRGKAHDMEVALFEYEWKTERERVGKHAITLTQAAVCFRLTGMNLPEFSLGPENFVSKIQWIGARDIDFESHPDFSKKYLLRGKDESFIRSIFTKRVLECFEAKPGLNAECADNTFVFYRDNVSKHEPERVRALMEEAFEVLSLFQPVEQAA